MPITTFSPDVQQMGAKVYDHSMARAKPEFINDNRYVVAMKWLDNETGTRVFLRESIRHLPEEPLNMINVDELHQKNV